MNRPLKFPLPHKVRPGRNEDFNFETRSGAVPSIQVNVTDNPFSSEDTIKVLKRLKTIIDSQPCKAVNSNTPGDKYTECNWGLCSEDPNLYYEPRWHTFPYDYINHGRVSVKHPKCPMDKDPEGRTSGCFYRCRIFQGPRPTDREALHLVQIRIDHLLKESNDQTQAP